MDDHVAGQQAHGTQTIYDNAGRVRFVKRWDNVVISITTVNGMPTSQLVSQGNLLSSTETIYDAAGRVGRTIDAAGEATDVEYDKRGLQTAVINALLQRSETKYDAAGRAISSKDPANHETKTLYDAAGRPVKTTFADGTSVSMAYDNRGRKISETDQVGKTTQYTYDEQGRLTGVILPQTWDPETSQLRYPTYGYTYDVYGNQVSITDAKQRTTTFAYDYAGRQVKRTLPGGAFETWQFNTKGQLTRHTDFKGQKEEPGYDAHGRMQERKWYAFGSGTPGDQVTYHYDTLGRMDFYVDARGTTSYGFDREGRTTQIVSPEGTINYGYDPATGRHTRMWTANSDWRYAYDELGRLETVKVHERDNVVLGTPETTTYRYNNAGVVDKVTHGNGMTTDNVYDALNRITGVIHKNNVAQLIAQYDYQRRADGRITRVTELDIAGQVAVTDYLFDELGRLAQEDYDAVAAGNDYVTDYVYDLVGNRLEKRITLENGTIEKYNGTFNVRDWLTTEEKRVNGVLTSTTTHGYDANGSLTSETSTTGDSKTYTWDLRNRLASATVVQGAQTTNLAYQYDDNGIQVRQTENGTTRYLLVDGMNPTGYMQVVEELTPGGVLLASFVYGMEPLSQSQAGAASFYLMDGHSGVRILLNTAATVLNRYRFDAYGGTLATSGSMTNPLRYRGERLDPVLGQYYLRARFYDPMTGRFTKLDPFVGFHRSPLSLHKYAYVHADPINATDPKGQFLCGLDFILAYVNGMDWAADAFSESDMWDPVGDVLESFLMGFVFALVTSLVFGGACFAAGTPLLTPGGEKNIEDFKVGDWILSAPENEPDGHVEARRVEELFTGVTAVPRTVMP